jgi:hypothetical protein
VPLSRINVDARFSRFFNLGYKQTRRLQAEFKNLFNKEQISGCADDLHRERHDRCANSDARQMETRWSPTSGYEQRKFQLGFKFFF